MQMALSWILLGALAAMLLVACWSDLRTRTIPNGLNLAIALLAIPFWWAIGLPLWPDVALQIGVALAVFAVFAGAFALGAMGGGDVKLVAAIALWLPWQAVLVLLFIMSVAGGRADARHADPAQARQTRRQARNSLWGRDRVRRFVAD